MTHQNQSRETTFGYLSTVHTAEHGYFGGYLIVCALGRPLEFHCTAPLRPSRAQEILYGPTLQPYLIGEQIGGTLLRAAKLTPRLVLTDQAVMLAARPQSSVPMACMLAASSGASNSPPDDSAGLASSDSSRRADQFEYQLPPGFESERAAVLESLALVARHVDLTEPFGRIREAIFEAQRIGRRSVENHDQAA